MRTKTRVFNLETELSILTDDLRKLEWYVSEVLATKPVRKYVKSGKYTADAKFARELERLSKRQAQKLSVTPVPKKHSRTWTDAQRQAHSEKMHKYWEKRREIA